MLCKPRRTIIFSYFVQNSPINTFLPCIQIIFLSQPKRNVYQRYQGWYFNKGADNTCKSLAAVNAENPDRYGNSELKIISGCREGYGGIGEVINFQSFPTRKLKKNIIAKYITRGIAILNTSNGI